MYINTTLRPTTSIFGILGDRNATFKQMIWSVVSGGELDTIVRKNKQLLFTSHSIEFPIFHSSIGKIILFSPCVRIDNTDNSHLSTTNTVNTNIAISVLNTKMSKTNRSFLYFGILYVNVSIAVLPLQFVSFFSTLIFFCFRYCPTALRRRRVV